MPHFTARGVLILPANMTHAPRGTVVISVEDVTEADAPAHVVAQETFVINDLAPGQAGSFSISGALDDPSRRYSLRATVDVDGDGKIGAGDLLSPRSHPIHPGSQRLEVPLTIVST